MNILGVIVGTAVSLKLQAPVDTLTEVFGKGHSKQYGVHLILGTLGYFNLM